MMQLGVASVNALRHTRKDTVWRLTVSMHLAHPDPWEGLPLAPTMLLRVAKFLPTFLGSNRRKPL